jgi:DNA adenine methylase
MAVEKTRKISARLPEVKLYKLMELYNTKNVTKVLETLIEERLAGEYPKSNGKMRSVINGMGGKYHMADELISLFPSHEIYIEPFGYTASVLLAKEPSKKEVYNDINGDVVVFFEVLRDCPFDLYYKAQSYIYSEEEFNKVKNDTVECSKIDRAARFYFLNRASYLGKESTFNQSFHPSRFPAKTYYQEIERFKMISDRLKGVEILHKQYYTVMRRYAKFEETFFFIDPPYFNRGCYKNNFEKKDFEHLAEILSKIKGKFLMTHPYDEVVLKIFTKYGFRYITSECINLPARPVLNEISGEYQKPKEKMVYVINYNIEKHM